MSSAQSCERLEEEKEELRGALDGVLQKVQEQHRLDLADLEERLKTFYSTEWEKVHQTYQEEADKCKAQMEQQVWRTLRHSLILARVLTHIFLNLLYINDCRCILSCSINVT